MKFNKKAVRLSDATFFCVCTDCDGFNIVGYDNRRAAQDSLDDCFQRVIPERLTLEYLEGTYEDMRECIYERRYIDMDEYEEIAQKFTDAQNRDFDYDDAYTDGDYAYYMPSTTKKVNGKKETIYDFGMIGRVFKREDFSEKYIVFWNDENDVYHACFKTKEEADERLKELLISAIPAEHLKEHIADGINKMDIDEEDIYLVDDIAYCTLSNPMFNAVIEDFGESEAAA